MGDALYFKHLSFIFNLFLSVSPQILNVKIYLFLTDHFIGMLIVGIFLINSSSFD